MVAFVPMNINNEESIETVLLHVDHAINYGEDVEPQVRKFCGAAREDDVADELVGWTHRSRRTWTWTNRARIEAITVYFFGWKSMVVEWCKNRLMARIPPVILTT